MFSLKTVVKSKYENEPTIPAPPVPLLQPVSDLEPKKWVNCKNVISPNPEDNEAKTIPGKHNHKDRVDTKIIPNIDNKIKIGILLS